MNAKDIGESLAAPFDISDIEFIGRGGSGGRILAVPYVTNRAIMTRLDKTVGVANWKNMFRPSPNGGVLCGISIKFGDEWITKWDGADNTQIEAVKGGLSGAMKRAAVQWGIGRFLYSAPDIWVQGETYTRGNKQLTRLGKAGKAQAIVEMKKWLDSIMRPYPASTIIAKLKEVERKHRYRESIPNGADALVRKYVSSELATKLFGGDLSNGAVFALYHWLNGDVRYTRIELDSIYEYFGIDKPEAS